MPGLIPGSHLNRGLGIQFLKHVERCAALLFLLDLAAPEPWTHLEVLQFELSQFNPNLLQRPQLVVGNKLDLPQAKVMPFTDNPSIQGVEKLHTQTLCSDKEPTQRYIVKELVVEDASLQQYRLSNWV